MLINSQLNEQIISARSRDALYRQDNKSLSRMTSATEAVPAKAVNPVLRMSSMTEIETAEGLKKDLNEVSITSIHKSNCIPLASSLNRPLIANKKSESIDVSQNPTIQSHLSQSPTLKTNTRNRLSKISSGQQTQDSLSKPILDRRCLYMADIKTLSKGDPYYKKYIAPREKVKKAMIEVIKKYKPTHFFTIQLEPRYRTDDYFIFLDRLKSIICHFEWKFLGRNWFKHPLRFIGIMEQGHTHYWHIHILLNLDGYSLEKMRKALSDTEIRLKLPKHCLRIDQINGCETVSCYCIKELEADISSHFNSDRIILSDELIYTDKK